MTGPLTAAEKQAISNVKAILSEHFGSALIVVPVANSGISLLGVGHPCFTHGLLHMTAVTYHSMMGAVFGDLGEGEAPDDPGGDPPVPEPEAPQG